MMQIDKTRPAPTSKKTLKFVPEFYYCNTCGEPTSIENYLVHLRVFHGIFLNERICIHGPIYNDPLAWKRTGDNCLEHNLLTIMDDGRFPGFKQIGGSDNSTDGSKELILSYPNTMYFAHGEDYEEAKFNFAMHLAAKMGFDYVILLGSDEWIVGDVNELVKVLDERMKTLPAFESQAFQVAIDEHQSQNKWNRFITESPKIYYGPGLLRTRFTHWLRYCGTCIAKDNLDHPLYHVQRRICTIVIHHDDSIRGKDRNDLMTKFQDKNVKREKNRVIKEALRNLFQVTFFLSNRILADWHKSFFIDAKPPYSHYIIYDDEFPPSRRLVTQFHKALLKNPKISVLSAVFRVGSDKSWRVTKDIPNAKFATPKIEEIYTKSKYNQSRRNFTLTLDVGPIIAINKDVVKEIKSISSKSEFMQQCRELGYQILCDSGLQVKEVKK